ncbi:hypothetical protein ABW636_21275 [Aquimarina sp. 2201CG1-2-11]|uniref:hypothetical protein n=1 Tax=Aquimarina discodermiae TaxID=3231043 RepID=UPI003461894C
MRLIQTLSDAINRIINKIDKGDDDGAKALLKDTYALLGQKDIFFHTQGVEDIINFFKEKEDNYIDKIQMLAKLLFEESRIENDQGKKKELLQKTKSLLEHYNSFSKEFSFEVQQQFSKVDQLLKQL